MRQIEGRNPVLEAIKASSYITKIYVEENVVQNPRIIKILNLAKENKIPIEKKNHLKEISKTNGRHQGIIAIAENLEEPKLKNIMDDVFQRNKIPLFVVISGVDYEHNLGSVLRSSDGAGVDCVIVSRKGFKLTPLVIKSSAGASEHIPVIHSNLFQALKELRKNGLKVIALKEGSDKTIYTENLNMPLVVIVGKEDVGIKEGFDKYIDEYLSIPMKGKINSLNMAQATTVTLFEVLRQRE